jgi:hypothetical protein
MRESFAPSAALRLQAVPRSAKRVTSGFLRQMPPPGESVHANLVMVTLMDEARESPGKNFFAIYPNIPK